MNVKKFHVGKFNFSATIVIALVGLAFCGLAIAAIAKNLSGVNHTFDLVMISIIAVAFLVLFIYSGLASKNTSKLPFVLILAFAFFVFFLGNLIYLASTMNGTIASILTDYVNYSTDQAREFAADSFRRQAVLQIVFFALSMCVSPFFLVFSVLKALDGQPSKYYFASFLVLLIVAWFAAYNYVNFFDNMTTLDSTFWAEFVESRLVPLSIALTYAVSVNNDYDPYLDPALENVKA